MRLHSLHERMQMDLAPAAGEAQLLLRCQRLVAKEDHAVVEQRRPNFRQYIVRQILRQIDARNFCPERTSDLPGFEIAILGIAWRIHRYGLLSLQDAPEAEISEGALIAYSTW